MNYFKKGINVKVLHRQEPTGVLELSILIMTKRTRQMVCLSRPFLS